MLASNTLVLWDWVIIAAVVLGTLGAALLFTKRAGSGLEEYFVSGRSLPWWLAGTSIVATTFACDTPLAITELVRKGGLHGNWYWWCFAGGHILGVVMLARLWRRSRLVTDISLIELRYEGVSAMALQVVRACYFGIVWNMFTIGWVTAAMLSIFSAAMGTPLTGPQASLTLGPWTLQGVQVHVAAVVVLMGVSMLYSLFAGLWGVVISDLLQFAVALAGAIILAVYAVNAAGGLETLASHPAVTPHAQMIPDVSRLWDGSWSRATWELPAAMFFMYVGLLWYTDKTADSGGYIAQRLLAAKDERHGTLAMLWFVVAHYALRPWPWMLAALASLVLLPDVRHIDAYPQMIMTILPVGLRGLLVASLLAAFISTVNTQLNWGASYLTRDVYIRLWRPSATQRELVWVGQVATFALMVLGAVVSYYISSIEQAWKFLSLLGAGSGLVLVGRWLWWRINAWSEITVLATALVTGVMLRWALPKWFSPFFPLPFAAELLTAVTLSTAAWLTVTLLTRPTSRLKLREFYLRTRPPGPLWRGIARECGCTQPTGALRAIALAWALGIVFIFSALFGIGDLLLLHPARGALLLAICAASGVAFFYANQRVGRKLRVADEPAPQPQAQQPAGVD